MATKNGGAAFPCPAVYATDEMGQAWTGTDGMSLRDWFAGQAMMGLLADPQTNASKDEMSSAAFQALVAKTAYAYADAMLAAREG